VPPVDWSTVPARIAALHAHPDRRTVHGATSHDFVLVPPLGTAGVADLEAFLGVPLPDDYRAFLAEVGAGGAGPFHGLNPVRRRDGGTGWEWTGAGTDLVEIEALDQPFPVRRAGDDALADHRARRPAERDFDDEQGWDDALDAWDDELEALLYPEGGTRGALCLADEGGAYYDWLVVSGPARGTMWEDPRCLDEDLRPVTGPDGTRHGFGTWYLAWLDASERELGCTTPD